MKKPAQIKSVPSAQGIAVRAYQVWEAAGRPHAHGRALEHWLAAEAQLRSAADPRQTSRLPGNRYGLVVKS